MNDDEVPVHGDRRRRQGGHVDADAHRHRHDVAQRLPERPRLQQAGDGGERDRQQAHDDVRDGQVGDEDVGDGLHGSARRHDVDHQAVAGDAQREYDDVQRYEDHTQPRPLHYVIADDAHICGGDTLTLLQLTLTL